MNTSSFRSLMLLAAVTVGLLGGAALALRWFQREPADLALPNKAPNPPAPGAGDGSVVEPPEVSAFAVAAAIDAATQYLVRHCGPDGRFAYWTRSSTATPSSEVSSSETQGNKTPGSKAPGSETPAGEQPLGANAVDTRTPPSEAATRLPSDERLSARKEADAADDLADDATDDVTDDTSSGFESSYNVLRHAGAVYALGMAEQRRPDPDVRDALLRSATYLKQQAIGPVRPNLQMLAVWSDPAIPGVRGPRRAKLGGAGLALVALVQVEHVQPGFTPRDQLAKLARFILYMQKPEGNFYSIYTPDERGRRDEWTSLYYPGEAALGLLMLYELDEDPRWLRGAADAIAYLASVPVPSGRRTEPDQWMLLAAARLKPYYAQSGCPTPWSEIESFAWRTCFDRLEEQNDTARLPDLLGCYTSDGRVCPTATRVEGLVAAHEMFSDNHDRPRRRQLADSLHDAVWFLLLSQIDRGTQRGGFPGVTPHRADLAAADSYPADAVRIDYVQHALCGLIGYEQHVLDAAASTPDESTRQRDSSK